MHEKINGARLPSVMALSYLGDAVHSLYVRRMLVGRGISKSGELNELSREYVTAEAQAVMLEKIKPHLLEDECDVCRRAENSTHLNKPKHAKLSEYRMVTTLLTRARRLQKTRQSYALRTFSSFSMK